MNNDIKEILEFKENADYKRLSVDEIAILEDYITNLQKEKDTLLRIKEIYRKKCLKISEYIKQNCEIRRYKDYDEIGKVEGIPLLNILEGSDKE